MQNEWRCWGSCLVHFLRRTRWFIPVFVGVEFVLPLDWDIYSLVCPLKVLFVNPANWFELINFICGFL